MTWVLIFWHMVWNCCPERYGKFQSEIPSTSGAICEKPQGGAFGPSPPAGRGLISLYCSHRGIGCSCGSGSGRWSAESCRRPDRGSRQRTGGMCRHLPYRWSRYTPLEAGPHIEAHSGSLRWPRLSGRPGRGGTQRPASGTEPQPLTSAAAAPRPAASCLRVPISCSAVRISR